MQSYARAKTVGEGNKNNYFPHFSTKLFSQKCLVNNPETGKLSGDAA